jgi:hypothetical protein
MLKLMVITLQAILFQRSLGAIQMVTEEIMECHIVSIDTEHHHFMCYVRMTSCLSCQAMLSDDLVAESVNEKVETFYRHIKTRQPAQDGSLGQVAVLLSQKRSKKTWFSSTEVHFPCRLSCLTERLDLMAYDTCWSRAGTGPVRSSPHHLVQPDYPTSSPTDIRGEN